MKGILFTGLLLGLTLTTAQAKVRVVTTLSDFAAIAREVGGELVEVDALTDGRRNPHYLEVLPSYMLKVKKADVFFWAGLDLEPWAGSVVDGARNKDLVRVDMSRGIDLMEVPTAKVDRSQGDIHVSGNPHYWLDPANGLIIAETITDALTRADPAHADDYGAGLASFRAHLSERIAVWKEMMEPYAGTGVVYFHNSWPYFNRAFGLETVAFIEPKPGVDPSPGHTAKVVSLMKERGVRVIVMEPYFSSKTPESLAQATGARVVTLAGSVGGIERTDDYVSLFETNLRLLEEALGP